ncbi:MAG TPA: glycoside hydrolase family 13 protein [Acidimicrobiia bacterium]|nr:glycoside hydrolase family 13 protein [Acidimicrobiia bacterium]
MPSRVKRPRSFQDDLGVFGLPGDVSPWDIRFDPADRAFLDRDPNGSYRLRVWSEPGLQEGLVVVRRDREVLGFPLELAAPTNRFDFWELLAPLLPGDQISLAFRDPFDRPVYRVPSGISGAVERLDRWVLPDLEPISVPGWAQGAVIYQIFPDRFANGDPTTNPPETDPWGSPPHSRRFQGGDLPGVTAHLDYLVALGVDLVYLNPIFSSPSNHRYDAIDYHQVDPALGGNDALVELVKSAHECDVRVILDASFNHSHPLFFAFQDLLRHGRQSQYRDWFEVHDWPPRIKVRPPVKSWHKAWLQIWEEEAGLKIEFVQDAGPSIETTYETWFGVPSMPRVNLAHPGAREFMLEVAATWIRETGIDGWRMDVARYVDPDFWKEFRTTVRAANPEAYLIGEFMGDASAWLQGDRFDATMNYTFRDIALRFLARSEIDAAAATDSLARLWAQYAWPVALANQNLIGSHDTPRFLTVAGGETWRSRLALVLQMTFPGAPGVYFGDEVGMEGDDDPGCRGAFPWDPDPTRHQLAVAMTELTALRRRHPALVTGEWRPLPSRGEVLGFERRGEQERLAVFINRGKKTTATIPLQGRLVWGEGAVAGRDVSLPRRCAAIVKLGR